MMQKKALTPFELVMRNIRYLSLDEKVAVGKRLATEEGVTLYTQADMARMVKEQVRIEIARRSSNLVVPSWGGK